MRWYTIVSIIIILVLSINQASALTFSPNEIDWDSAVTGTLHNGQTLTNGEFMVKAVQFPGGVPGIKDVKGNILPETDVDPMVYLEIYKNGVMIKEIVMIIGSEAYIDPDYEAKISTTAFIARNAKEWVLEYYNPWATVSIQKRALPKLEVIVTTDKTTYNSNSAEIIKAKVEVKNTGTTFLKKVDVDLNIGDLKLRGGELSQLHMYYDRLEKGATAPPLEVVLLVPDLIDQKSYNLSAKTKGYDAKDLVYNDSDSVSPIISPKQNYFSISKAVRDRIYLQDYASVRITVANGGMYDIHNIHITDNMSDKFVLSSSPTTFAWDIPLLKPGEEWSTGYSIKPVEAKLDGWTIPAASATFAVNNKPYSASSSTITLIVNGPKLLVNKTVSKPVVNISEDVIVTVSVNNVGNIGTRTDVKDSLPDDVSLVSGQLSNLTFSEPAKTWGFSYIIRINKEGDYELPAAVANYTNVEYRGTVHDVKSSERPVITVVDPSKPRPILNQTANQTAGGTIPSQGNPGTNPQGTPVASSTSTPDPTPTPITPGFEFAFAVIILIFAAGFKRK